ncbi:DUF2207 domain-containing protein [Actinospongicola halichondriae]|uniref:DUF2207 domain-containing protein n=1 Tax=Actinospongicola halichondriae TaxID=3236844 RepID=UPI003D4F7473
MMRRRRLSMLGMVVLAALPAVVQLVGLLVGGRERIVAYFEVAAIDADGSARVEEVIDYDFGAGSERHGIIRVVPGLTFPSDVSVSSPDAPAQVQRTGNSLRIGDPSVTISGAHRYLIGYDIDTLIIGDRLAWNIVGNEWEVGIEAVEAHVLSDRTLEDLSCDQGSFGATGGCEAVEVEPGHIVVRTSGIGSGEAVTVRARLGSPVAAAPTPPAIPPPAGDTGAPLALPALFGYVAALVAALVTGRVLRRAGREFAPDPLAGDADGSLPVPPGTARVDVDDLLDDAPPRVAPPRRLTAAQGGVVLAEKAKKEHQAAWLLDQAQHGALVLEGDPKKPTMRWLGGNGAADNAVLLTMFDSRPAVQLGTYDTSFASGWSMVAAELDAWRTSSGLWSPEGERRAKRGALYGVLGLVVTLPIIAFLAYRWSLASPTVAQLAVLTVPAGVAIGAALKAWELRVRTPAGSALYAEVEAFRRFLGSAGVADVERVDESGQLHEYLAWAVALGETGAWTKALDDSAVSMASGYDPSYWLIAHNLHSSTSSAATSPSSSGGGGAGGGGGGGGGGSW